MEILLIRHSIAEDRRADLDDVDRRLTQKGIQRFRELMPVLQKKLEPLEEREILFWSSPAKRATETADIVTEELGFEIDEIKDFIYYGDFEDLSEDVQDVDDELILLITGHEPLLSDWTKDLSGEDVKIKKGAMLNFKVLTKSPLKAELLWVISP